MYTLNFLITVDEFYKVTAALPIIFLLNQFQFINILLLDLANAIEQGECY